MSEKNEKNVQHSLGKQEGRRAKRILSVDGGRRTIRRAESEGAAPFRMQHDEVEVLCSAKA